MLAYIVRRLLLIIPTLFGILLINFLIIQAAPGGPVEQMIANLEGFEGGATSRVSGGGSEAARLAQASIAQSSRSFEDHLTTAISDLPPLPRIQLATDLMLGKRTLFLQQPSMFYFPELPQRAFYERSAFDWVPAVEAMTDAIVAELEAVRAQEDAAFAPYQVMLVALNVTNEEVARADEAMYQELQAAGLEVLYDDREDSAGVKLNDADLLGLPVRVVVSPRNLKQGEVEVKARSEPEASMVSGDQAVQRVRELLG